MGRQEALGDLSLTRCGRFPLRLALALATAALLAGAACGPSSSDTAAIDAAALAARIADGSAPLVLDVRSPSEFEAGHIPGARNIPYDELPQRFAELPADRGSEIVVHCQTGRRAEIAERALAEAGYTNVHDLSGHWAGWSAAQLPRE